MKIHSDTNQKNIRKSASTIKKFPYNRTKIFSELRPVNATTVTNRKPQFFGFRLFLTIFFTVLGPVLTILLIILNGWTLFLCDLVCWILFWPLKVDRWSMDRLKWLKYGKKYIKFFQNFNFQWPVWPILAIKSCLCWLNGGFA